MSANIPADAPRPRLCHMKKWPDFNGYGFNLHAEKGKVGQFAGAVDPNSPASYAGLKEGDRIVEVNDTNVSNENHGQVVQRIKAVPTETKLLVVDRETDEYYKNKRIFIRGDMANILVLKSPDAAPSGDDDPPHVTPSAAAPAANGPVGGMSSHPPHHARQCTLRRWPHFQGYGFNLHAEKSKAGQFLGAIDKDSPAEAAGLRDGDRIVEVNDVNIADENHQQVVGRIKAEPSFVQLLVVDPECDAYFKENGIAIRGDMPYVVRTDSDKKQDEPVAAPAMAMAVHSAPIPANSTHHARLCLIRKWPHFQGYGFNLHAEKGKEGHYIGNVEDESPAAAASLKSGDKIIEVNGSNVVDIKHHQVVEHVKERSDEVEMLVVDEAAEKHFLNNDVRVHSGMAHVVRTETLHHTHTEHTPPPEPEEPEPPSPEEAAATVAAVATASANAVDDQPHHHPRLCHVRKWHDFEGYGFNLHAEKGKIGHFIGNIDEGSPSEAAGLLQGDTIVEVNGSNVESDTHHELVTKIKADADQVKMLVVDDEAKAYFVSRDVEVEGGMEGVEYIECPVHEHVVTELPPAYTDLSSQPNGQVAQVEMTHTQEAEPEPHHDEPDLHHEPEPVIEPEPEVHQHEPPPAPVVVEVNGHYHEEPERQPSPELDREPSPEPVRKPSPEPIREPSPEPIRPPSPEPVRAPSPPPAVREPEPPVERPPEPKPQPPSDDASRLTFGSAAEARARMSRKKKADPRQSQMSMQEKYKLFQNL